MACIRIFFVCIINFFSKPDLFVSYVVLKTNPVVSVVFTFSTYLSYTVFLTTSFFTASLSLLKSTGTGANLSIPSLSTLVFKLAKSDFSAKLLKSTCVTSFRSVFVA